MRRDFIVCGLCMAVCVLFLCVKWGITPETIKYPIIYSGWDDFETYLDAQNIIDTGWVWRNPRLAAPFEADFHDFPVVFLHNFDELLLKIIIMLVPDPFCSVNILFVITPGLIALTSYCALRILGVSKALSFFGAVDYALLPFVFLRNELHLMLTMYMFIPLAFIVCKWAYCQEIFNDFSRKNFLGNKKNLLAILFIIFIANNGTGYWQAFSAYFMLATALSAGIGNLRRALPALVSFTLLLFFFFINLIPFFYIDSKMGKNPVILTRNAAEADAYGMKLTAMLLPCDVTLKISEKIDKYHDDTKNDGATYIGAAGSVGFFLLLAFLLSPPKDDTLRIFSHLNIMGTLCGVIGGFGTMGMVFLAPGTILRVFSRMSLYIAFIAIAALTITLTKKINSTSKQKSKACEILVCLFFTMGIFAQYPANSLHDHIVPKNFKFIPPDFDLIRKNFSSDHEFITSVENLLPDGAMIYQMPYHKFPEGGNVKNMLDYQHLTGVLHSKTLRFSYGAVKGRQADAWNEKTASAPYGELVRQLRKKKFSGIYIDRRAYDVETVRKLEGEFERILKVKPLESINKNLSFFRIS